MLGDKFKNWFNEKILNKNDETNLVQDPAKNYVVDERSGSIYSDNSNEMQPSNSIFENELNQNLQEYSEENIQEFEEQIIIYQPIYGAKCIKDAINGELKDSLDIARTSTNIIQNSVNEVREEDKQLLEENLTDLEKTIYSCATLATNGDKEQAKLLLASLIKENDIQFDPEKDCYEKRKYLVALGDALLEHTEKTYAEILGDKSYEDYQEDYENSYAKTFGKKNASKASEAYMISQEYTVDGRFGSVYLEDNNENQYSNPIFKKELNDDLQSYAIDIIHNNGKSSLINVGYQDKKDGVVANYWNFLNKKNMKIYELNKTFYTENNLPFVEYDSLKFNKENLPEIAEIRAIRDIHDLKTLAKVLINHGANTWNSYWSFKSGENSRSTVIEETCSEFDDVKSLAQAFKKSDYDFATTFLKTRGVIYSDEKIQEFQEQVETYQPIYGAKCIKDAIDGELKDYLDFARNSIDLDINNNLTYKVREEDKQLLEESLTDLETSIYACATLGTNGDKEQAKLLLASLIKENDIQFDPKKDCYEKRKYLVALGDALVERTEKTYAEILGDKSYEDYQENFNHSYARAFGEQNASEASEAYMKSQESGVVLIKGAAVFAAGILSAGGGTIAIAAASGGTNLLVTCAESDTDGDGHTQEEFSQNLKESGATAALSMLEIDNLSFGDDITRASFLITDDTIKLLQTTKEISEFTIDAVNKTTNDQKSEDSTTLIEILDFKYKKEDYTS